MGIATRLRFAALVGIGNTILALLYATAGTELFALVDEHPGTYTHVVDTIQTLVPPLIGLLYLFVVVVILVGPFQYERARSVRRRFR
jgi:hypothetical protein